MLVAVSVFCLGFVLSGRFCGPNEDLSRAALEDGLAFKACSLEAPIKFESLSSSPVVEDQNMTINGAFLVTDDVIDGGEIFLTVKIDGVVLLDVSVELSTFFRESGIPYEFPLRKSPAPYVFSITHRLPESIPCGTYLVYIQATSSGDDPKELFCLDVLFKKSPEKMAASIPVKSVHVAGAGEASPAGEAILAEIGDTQQSKSGSAAMEATFSIIFILSFVSFLIQ